MLRTFRKNPGLWKTTFSKDVLFIWSLIVIFSSIHSSHAFQITSASFNTNGVFELQVPVDPGSYYILYRGSTITNVTTPTRIVLGANFSGQLSDTNFPGPISFYRVHQVATNAPVDSDGDRIDDIYEMNHPSILDPLNSGDGNLDPDSDGWSNFQEYLAGTDPTVVSHINHPVINELDYDQIGTDSAEFVELYNPSTNTIALADCALIFINGANSAEYLRVNLSGTLASNQYFVLGSTNVSVFPGTGVMYFTNDLNNIQNGAPDGVVLFNLATHQVIDVLSYEGAVNNANIVGESGTFNLVEGTLLPASIADSNVSTASFIRSPDAQDTDDAASDWKLTTLPTPGTANILQ